MIRPGLFHCTKNPFKDTAVILEIETPIDIDDLVRFKDNYGRENKPYEDKKNMVKLSNNDPVLEEPQMNKENNYILNGINIQIVKTDKLNILNNLKKNSIVAILDGGLESVPRRYCGYGDNCKTF